jgi:hypothetical protein
MRIHFSSASIATLAALASLTSGCFGNDPLGLDGDWSNGDRNNTQWQIGDGLCPGLSGGCALNVPLAVGVSTSLVVEGVSSATPTVNTPANVADVAIRGDAEGQRATISFTTTAPGAAHFVISDARGVVDEATVQVRQQTGLECGVFPGAGEPNWAIAGITFREANTVGLEPSTSTAAMNSLACRTFDASGALLSSRGVRWSIVTGTAITLQDDDFDPAAVRGARVDYVSVERGTAQVRAEFGDVSDTFTVTVE